MNTDQLAQRLKLVALLQASQLGMDFNPDCLDGYLTPFIQQGAQNLAADQMLDNAAAVAMAEASIRRMVAGMVMEAQKLGLERLHETTFWNVRQWFCPCFPFC